MKQQSSFLTIFILAAGFVIFTAFGGDENSDYPQGAPEGYTGSPGDGKDCVNCHGGTSSVVSGWITSDIPPEGYTPGSTYSITVTVTGIGEKGFEVSPQDVTGQQLGTLIAGSGNHLVGGTKYVTHNSSNGANPMIWNFEWKAPITGTGTVTFYGAFAVTKPVTKTSTLVVGENPFPISTITSADPPQIVFGDSTHLNVDASGGTGIYTYIWTSDPLGFNSNEQSPWAKPAESTRYFVEVSDGISVVMDSVDVTVFGVGINGDHTSRMSWSFFPNPVNEILTISVDVSRSTELELNLRNFQGKRVWQKQVPVHPGHQNFSVDMTCFPAGVYYIHANDRIETVVEKIVRSR